MSVGAFSHVAVVTFLSNTRFPRLISTSSVRVPEPPSLTASESGFRARTCRSSRAQETKLSRLGTQTAGTETRRHRLASVQYGCRVCRTRSGFDRGTPPRPVRAGVPRSPAGPVARASSPAPPRPPNRPPSPTHRPSPRRRTGTGRTDRAGPRVAEPPRIHPFTAADGYHEGGRVGWQCFITSGDGPLSIQWLKDNRPLSLDPAAAGSLSVSNQNEYSSSVLIESVRLAHEGNYTCRAANPVATVEHTVALTVLGKRLGRESPLHARVSVGPFDRTRGLTSL